LLGHTTLQRVIRVVVGPGEPLLGVLETASHRHAGGTLRVAVAWARDEGVARLLAALGDRVESLHVIVGLNERGTTAEALLRLLPVSDSLTVFFKHPRQTFHPKVYWFAGKDGATTVLVGSANLTRGGLMTNFEVDLEASIPGTTPEEEELVAAVSGFWQELLESPYSHNVEDAGAVRGLYEDGYVSLEATLRRERRRAAGRGDGRNRGTLPTAPPPPVAGLQYEAVDIPFPVVPAEVADAPPEDVDPEGAPALPERFFVRTLTANDVAKAHGQQVGTFEPDLGEMARDRYPAFWGWPDHYETVVRELPRDEWAARGRLISSETSPEGVDVEVMLWYRELRPEHAAEHRIRLGPIGDVRTAVPATFDTDSLVVVQRGAGREDVDFIIRLITPNDPGYADYSAYATVQRPHHRFGYGP